MPDMHLHRGRHYFATALLRGGANIRVVQELMRHSSLATTAKYLAVSADELRAAVGGL
jgi:integrase/recombinase XerD